MPPYIRQAPSHPHSQAPGPPTTPHIGGVGHRDLGAQAPGVCIDAGHTTGWPGPVAE